MSEQQGAPVANTQPPAGDDAAAAAAAALGAAGEAGGKAAELDPNDFRNSNDFQMAVQAKANEIAAKVVSEKWNKAKSAFEDTTAQAQEQVKTAEERIAALESALNETTRSNQILTLTQTTGVPAALLSKSGLQGDDLESYAAALQEALKTTATAKASDFDEKVKTAVVEESSGDAVKDANKKLAEARAQAQAGK